MFFGYSESNDSDLPLDGGRTYSMDIVGYDRRSGSSYGWVNGVRVFIGDCDSGAPFRPGDTVSVEISAYGDRSAIAKVTGNQGCFLDNYMNNGRTVGFVSTDTSKRDFRDLIGEIKFGRKSSGIFTIVPDAKSMARDEFSFDEFDISISRIKTDKNGKYVVIGEPVNDYRKRDNSKEMFIGYWSDHGRGRPNMGMISANGKVPKKNLRGAMFFDRTGNRFIVTPAGRMEVPRLNGHELTDPDGIRYYVNRFCKGADDLKLIVAADFEYSYPLGSSKDMPRYAGMVSQAFPDMDLELLPLHFFEPERGIW